MGLFGKKKPQVSGPISVKKVTAYAKVPGALADVPTASQFRSRCSGFKMPTGHPADHKLNLISYYLDCYAGRESGEWAEMAILGELYFLADYWLKMADWVKKGKIVDTDDPALVASYKANYQPVYSLYVTICDRLCQPHQFNCQINILPQKLEEYWGRILTPHGDKIDHQDMAAVIQEWKKTGKSIAPPRTKPGTASQVAQYLTRSEAEAFRLVFFNGVAFRSIWWTVAKVGGGTDAMTGLKRPPLTVVVKDPREFMVADTRFVDRWMQDSPGMMMDVGYAGFALSMGRELYSCPHFGSYHLENFFHSSYLAGDTVLCTGTILIEGGIVKAIRNDSGHYQPTLEHLLNVVLTLQMHGQDPANILVRAVGHSWKNDAGVVQTTELKIKGDVLIKQRMGAWGKYFAWQANEAQRDARGR